SWMARPTAGDLRTGLLFWGDHATLILAALAIVLIAVRGRRAAQAGLRPLGFAMAVVVLVIGGAFAVSHLRPVYLAARTPVLALPAASLFLAVLATELGPVLVTVATALVVASSAVRYTALSRQHPDPFPTRASLAAVAGRMRCGDAIVAAGLSLAPLTYYAP